MKLKSLCVGSRWACLRFL